jgi:WD40 repeat protein
MLYKVNSQTGEINATTKSDQSITALSDGLANSFLAGNSEGELGIYDATSLKLKKSIKAHKSWIREIHSIENGKYFLTASDDKALKKWNTPDLSESKTLNSEGWITSVDYFVDNKNGGVIRATGTRNGKISVSTNFANYHANAHAIINRIVLLKNIIPVIQVIVATHGGGIQIWSGTKMKIKNQQ